MGRGDGAQVAMETFDQTHSLTRGGAPEPGRLAFDQRALPGLCISEGT